MENQNDDDTSLSSIATKLQLKKKYWGSYLQMCSQNNIEPKSFEDFEPEDKNKLRDELRDKNKP